MGILKLLYSGKTISSATTDEMWGHSYWTVSWSGSIVANIQLTVVIFMGSYIAYFDASWGSRKLITSGWRDLLTPLAYKQCRQARSLVSIFFPGPSQWQLFRKCKCFSMSWTCCGDVSSQIRLMDPESIPNSCGSLVSLSQIPVL